MKAYGGKTPQLSPAIHSAVHRAQGGGYTEDCIGTPERVSTLRSDCLERDRHRCVISRKFDHKEALRRLLADGEDNARDDDGKLLVKENSYEFLEVAHILPHALTKVDTNLQAVYSFITVISSLAYP